MAPMLSVDHDNLEKQLKDTIQSLHNIMVQVTYDATATATSLSPPTSSSTAPSTAPPTTTPTSSATLTSPRNGGGGTTTTTSREVLADELTALSRSLQTVHRTSSTRALPHVPPELIQYVDNGRNPDVYTREFVELVRRGNQLMRGKQNAFAAFRDVLAGEIERAMPELRDDVAKVIAATGGRGANTNTNPSTNANAGAGAGNGAEAKTTTTTGLDK